jgi:hypothetical protein
LAGTACGSTNPLSVVTIGACTTAFVGQQAEGQPCNGSAECNDGLTCVGYNAQLEGTCEQPPADGAACGEAPTDGGATGVFLSWKFGDHPDCAPGAYCRSGACKAQANAGESCSPPDGCAAGLSCYMGKCSSAGLAGENGACASSGDCQDGLRCAFPAGGGAGACLQKENAGAACSQAFGDECKGRCDVPDGGTSGACVSFCGSQ